MKSFKKLRIRISIILLSLLIPNAILHAQDVIYQENCGTPNANTLIQNYHGWQDTTVSHYGNGTCDVRTSSASTGYGQASGGGNIMINDTLKWFLISGLNTSSYTDVRLYCGLRKTTAENGNNFVVETSTDSLVWTRLQLSDTLPTGTGTSGWFRVQYPSVPSSSSLFIRFSNLSNVDYRLDDITLVSGEETHLETVAKPTFSPGGGTYYEPQTVTITSATENVHIYFTLDGSTPTEASNAYLGPISINNSVTLKAIALRSGMYDSEVASTSYVVLDTNALLELPFDISSNSENEHLDISQIPGFRGYHLGSSYADGSVKFEASQANKAMLVAHLDSSPERLIFDLKGKNGGSNPSAYEGIELVISESSDNQHWHDIATITENEIATDNFVRFSDFALQSDTRFIRWKLVSAAKGNTQLNNIVITKRTESEEDSTSVAQHIGCNLHLYPNPTNGNLYFDHTDEPILTAVLFSIEGRRISHWTNPTNSISLDDVPNGIYLLEIQTSKGLIREKIIKQ